LDPAAVRWRHPELNEQLVHLRDLANDLWKPQLSSLAEVHDQANQYLEGGGVPVARDSFWHFGDKIAPDCPSFLPETFWRFPELAFRLRLVRTFSFPFRMFDESSAGFKSFGRYSRLRHVFTDSTSSF
jgi:hypothetical protein